MGKKNGSGIYRTGGKTIRRAQTEKRLPVLTGSLSDTYLEFRQNSRDPF